jgi:hypothetical protein
MRARKTWREKLADSKGLPRVSEVSGKRVLVADLEKRLFTGLAQRS